MRKELKRTRVNHLSPRDIFRQKYGNEWRYGIILKDDREHKRVWFFDKGQSIATLGGYDDDECEYVTHSGAICAALEEILP